MDAHGPTNMKMYGPGLKRVRFRRLLLWVVILIYLPAMVLALDSADYRRWATIVFASWIILLIVAVTIACLARCPRCGELFHTQGPTFLPLRRCLHCSLHIKADKRLNE